jgi:hypothetical protein
MAQNTCSATFLRPRPSSPAFAERCLSLFGWFTGATAQSRLRLNIHVRVRFMFFPDRSCLRFDSRSFVRNAWSQYHWEFYELINLSTFLENGQTVAHLFQQTDRSP